KGTPTRGSRCFIRPIFAVIARVAVDRSTPTLIAYHGVRHLARGKAGKPGSRIAADAADGRARRSREHDDARIQQHPHDDYQLREAWPAPQGRSLARQSAHEDSHRGWPGGENH